MFKELTAALRGVSDLTGRLSRLEESVEELEDRMDTDEGKRIEWVGTVKRVLARINRANARDEEDTPRNAAVREDHNGSDFAEAQRLGLFR